MTRIRVGSFGAPSWASNANGGKVAKSYYETFRKLLFFKAPLKFLVYECPKKDRDLNREELLGRPKNFEQHVKDERYLLIEFIKRNDRFQQEARVFHV